MVARPGAAPGISSFQARQVRWLHRARKSEESGGLCGLCSRDLPLDKRLLFVAELTGLYIKRGGEMKWCGVQVMLPIGFWLRFYGPARVFSDLPPRESESGCGTWSRTTMAKLMRLRRLPNLPAIHG